MPLPLKIVSISLKIFQIVVLSAGTGLVGYFVKEYHDAVTENDPVIDPFDLGQFGRYEFFLYSTGVAFAITVLGFVFVFTGLQEKKHGAFAMALLQVFCALQLAVSTGLLDKALVTYKKELELEVRGITITRPSFCDQWDEADTDFQCTHIKGGVVCGFLAAVWFALDAINSFITYNKSSH